MFKQNILIFIILLFYSNIIWGQNVNQDIKYFDNEKIKKIEVEKRAIKTELFFYENGLLKSISSLYLNKEHGKYLSYYSNGQLFVDGQYDKGTPVGNWVEYYKNGDTLCKYFFTNGILHIDKYKQVEPIIIFEKSERKLKYGVRNNFQIIFPNLPNKFIYAMIHYGSMIRIGVTHYSLIAKKPGKAELVFRIRKNNITDNSVIYRKKIIIK